jgi:maltoporin
MKAILRSVALSHGLTFYDRSAEVEAESKAITEVQKSTPIEGPTVLVGATARDGMGFGAGNFAEAPSQFVVGFSKSNDPTSALRLSDTVVQALAQRWRIHEVPHVDTSGAFPLKHCDTQ